MIDDFDKVYEGTEPYLFISYSHKDNDRVIPVIHGLQKLGYRVWYDTGITIGGRWTDIIAEHVMNSNCVVAFLSENSKDSEYCQEEIHFALDEHKTIVPIYLEEVILPPGLRMRLKMLQSIDLFRFPCISKFLERLSKEVNLQPSLSKRILPETSSLSKPTQHPGKSRRSHSEPPIDYHHKKVIPAVDLMMETKRVSYAMIRQHLRTSYKSTQRLMDEIVSLGIIAPFDGSPYGKLLITPQEWEKMKKRMKFAE